MLYKLDDKLYVVTNSYYTEVEIKEDDGEITLSPTTNRIARRLMNLEDFERVNFEDEKRKYIDNKKKVSKKETKENDYLDFDK